MTPQTKSYCLYALKPWSHLLKCSRAAFFADFGVYSCRGRAGTFAIGQGNFYFPTPSGHHRDPKQKLNFPGRRQILLKCGWRSGIIWYPSRHCQIIFPHAGGSRVPGQAPADFFIYLHIWGWLEGGRMVPARCLGSHLTSLIYTDSSNCKK